MDHSTTLPLTKADFYAFIAKEPEGRYEFEDGRIVDMTGGTQRHARLGFEIAFIIGQQLDRAIWSITIADRAVDLGTSVRYPDVVVEAAATAHPTSLKTLTPVLIVEVLSPSSVDRDLEAKTKEYAELESLEAYIVVDQANPTAWVWQRDAHRHFVRTVVEGADGVVVIPTLSLVLRLADAYRLLPPTTA
jgi:Uma2 family endonuclease